jgi:hypothetical protein
MRNLWLKKITLPSRGWLSIVVAALAAISLVLVVTHFLSFGTSAIARIKHAPARSPQPVTAPTRFLSQAKDNSRPVYKPRIRVWVQADDIRPSVIHTRPGPLRLSVENASGADVSLVIEKVLPGRASLRAAKMKTLSQIKRATQEIELGVGEYIFYEESRPNITGKLIVEANQ